MFVSFSILLRTELSDTQKSLPWGHRAGCVALTQLPSPSCSPQSTFVHSTNKSGCSEGLSQEGKRWLWQEDPSGALCWARWWVFLSQEGQTLSPHPGSCCGAGKGGGSRPALSVTAKMTCWVSVKRIGEQTCFLDLKHLGWATLVKASVGGASSSSLAAITIQLTFMLSLRTQAKRATLLTHPQSPAEVYISWIVNSWMFSKLPPLAPKEEINGANSHPPPCSSGQREQRGNSRQLHELLPAHRQSTATGPLATWSNSAAAPAGPERDFQQTGQCAWEKELALTAGSQGGFSETVLLKWSRSYGIQCRVWRAPGILTSQLSSRHWFQKAKCLEPIGKALNQDIKLTGDERRKNSRVERALALGQTWVHILVPSLIAYVASHT